jgi:hypothetical protein
MLFLPFLGYEKRQAKEILLKELFGSSKQKRAIRRAARESAKDQRDLVEKYQAMVRQK